MRRNAAPLLLLLVTIGCRIGGWDVFGCSRPHLPELDALEPCVFRSQFILRDDPQGLNEFYGLAGLTLDLRLRDAEPASWVLEGEAPLIAVEGPVGSSAAGFRADGNGSRDGFNVPVRFELETGLMLATTADQFYRLGGSYTFLLDGLVYGVEGELVSDPESCFVGVLFANLRDELAAVEGSVDG